MAAELIIAPEADDDLAEAYAWYEVRQAGLGEQFLTCVDACIQSVRRMPEMHAVIARTIAERSYGVFRTLSSTTMSLTW